jgi:hypothetical protein
MSNARTEGPTAELHGTPLADITSRSGASAGRTTTPGGGLGLLVAAAAILSSLVYLASDVIEVVQGDFSTFRLSLTYVGEAVIPLFVLGLYAVQRPRVSRLGLFGAVAYAYAYIFFTATVLYALVARTRDYAALTKVFGIWMTVHGAVLVVGGLAFGLAVVRAGVLPRWTGLALMIGVVLVAAASSFPALARAVAGAVPDLAFAGMGVALARAALPRRT